MFEHIHLKLCDEDRLVLSTPPRPGVQHLQKGHGIFRYEDREASAVDTYHGRCSDEEEQHVPDQHVVGGAPMPVRMSHGSIPIHT